MKFQVGRFTCEMSLDDGGHGQAQWIGNDVAATRMIQVTFNDTPVIACTS